MGKARRGLETLTEAFGLLRQASEKNGQAHTELTSATEGTGNDRIDSSLGRLDQVAQALSEALAHGGAGRDGLTEYLTLIGAEGALTRGTDTPSTGEPPAAATPSVDPFSDKASRPPAPAWDADKDSEIEPYAERAKTVGRAYTADGQPISDELIWSGREGSGKGGPGLREPWARMETMTMHVEGHITAMMRQDRSLTDVVAYTNRDPCDYVPNGCVYRTEEGMPKGTRLTIYTTESRRRPTIFIGNGKGLTDGSD
ncbi:hypothetical protein Afil01_30560 [Actinorhabdospora filicis]|uniref:Nucleic acid/nucleotide deaminase of polymorphic system toxin n=2 Tax=Actinorhabdospora filicis TaxID=1785913 RepID=A0A9W6SM14_9ACTN|nr:hypothetical protein Afil01_30560 [Actinorhabdospora filicis]